MAEISDVMEKLTEIETKLGELETKIGETKDLQRFCRHCHGTGNKTSPDGPGSCVNCGGSGRKKIGELVTA